MQSKISVSNATYFFSLKVWKLVSTSVQESQLVGYKKSFSVKQFFKNAYLPIKINKNLLKIPQKV